jgi:small subunit ribosomal protein S9
MSADSIRFYATGRRKEAVARVWLTAGSGKITVNGRTFEDFFSAETHRMHVSQPLTVLEKATDYDIVCTVKGGGPSGQAGAVRHGLSRALVNSDEDFRKPLRKAGLLTRDAREVERKKYGQPGARKQFQFSKR